MSNGDMPATEPATNVQMLLALVREVDRLAQAVEELLGGGLEGLRGEIGEVRTAVEGNQSRLQVMSGLLSDLGAAANLALHRLPPHGTAPPARSKLADRIRAARQGEASLLERLIGPAPAQREDVVSDIQVLANVYQTIIGELGELVYERFGDETVKGS